MISDDEDVVLAACAIAVMDEQIKQSSKRRGRVWEGPVCSNKKRGAYNTTVPLLVIDNDTDSLVSNGNGLPRNRLDTFQNYFRMSRSTFDLLLSKVAPKLEKRDTNFRLSIPAEEKLMATLRYLASGCSITEMHYNWKMSTASLSLFIPVVCFLIIMQFFCNFATISNSIIVYSNLKS